MSEIDALSGTMDSIGLKVSVALLPLLLREKGTLKYTEKGRRVSKTSYKPFLKRILHNVNTLLTNKNKAEIFYENPITREQIAKDLMNSDDRSKTITIKQYFTIISAQQTLLLSTVDAARRHLVEHKIAISNLAETTIHQR